MPTLTRTARLSAIAAVAVAAVASSGCGTVRPSASTPAGPWSGICPRQASAVPRSAVPGAAVQTIATGLCVPWGLAFLPDGTALVGERDTARLLSIAVDGRVTEIQHFADVRPGGRPASAEHGGEGGLLGIAVSPDYATDRWVYAYYATADDNRVARFHLGEPAQPILAGIPVADPAGKGAGLRAHQGGRIAFGPDGMLYVAAGETYYTPDIAQDRASLGDKILRITPDGKPAPGNPFGDSPVYSLGHRNVQGLAWDSAGRLYASELGLGTFDELNAIQPGGNYGWPVVEGPGTDPRFINPLATWSPTSVASPSGIAIVNDRIYVACLAGKRLYRVSLDGRTNEALYTGQFGRLRTIAAAPDGSLWALTSNRDGIGTPAAGDDRILRIVPDR